MYNDFDFDTYDAEERALREQEREEEAQDNFERFVKRMEDGE